MGLRYHTQKPDKLLLWLIPTHHSQSRLSTEFSACEGSRLSTPEIKVYCLHTTEQEPAVQSHKQALIMFLPANL